MFMKTTNLYLAMLGLAVGGALGACSSMEDNGLVNNGGASNGVQLVKAPNVIAYSGVGANRHVWGGVSKSTLSRGSDTEANTWDQRWDCPPRPAEDLTDAELAELKELLSFAKETHNTTVLPFENYYVQQIYKGEDKYLASDRCAREAYDGSGEIKCGGNNYCDHLTSGDHTTNTEVLGSDQMDKLLAAGKNGYEHIDNFNHGTNTNYPGACGCGKSHFGTTLMTDMPTTGFDAESQFGFHETWGTSHDYCNYYIVEYKGYYYVGFDYEAHKYDQNTHNHGEGLDIDRDWNFTDWIVRITPAYPKGTTPGGTEPEQPSVPGGDDHSDDVCPDCSHTPHDGTNCEICDAMDGTCANNSGSGSEEVNPNPGEGDDQPGVVVPGERRNEVETNLAVDKKGDGSLESHLSIHVRAATDVEIFIPVPSQYYCDADDMAIVNKHEDGFFVHGGPHTTTYDINGNIVTLNVEFVEDGIRIWTEGINQDVIDYCYENFQDGITFEVWNYFNDPEKLAELGLDEGISFEDLKYLLNHATIKFLDEVPDEYINAFVGEGYENNDPGTHDNNEFHVTPVDQADSFDGPQKGEHLNGSDNNEIYTKK